MILRGVFLIASTTAFLRFTHFTFKIDYLEYLDTEDKNNC